MTRPAFEMADIVRRKGRQFLERFKAVLNYQQLKAFRAVKRCRTAALGGHRDKCEDCTYEAPFSYNSCRSRCCPKCQAQARRRWLHQRVLIEQIIPGVTKFGPRIAWQIVGIYSNVHAANQKEENPQMLIPFWQTPWPQAGFGVRTAEKPASMLQSIAAAVHSVDPGVALAQPKTMDEWRDDTIAQEHFTLVLFSSFATVALFLAALGIYGVISYSVANRGREIALRMALGAAPNRVIKLVVREGVLLAAIGLGLGLIGAYFVGRAMQSMLFGVPAVDFSAFGSVAAILLASAVLACFLPSWRAAKLDPMSVLRTE